MRVSYGAVTHVPGDTRYPMLWSCMMLRSYMILWSYTDSAYQLYGRGGG